MFDDWKLRRTAAKDVQADIPRAVAVERYVTARHNTRPQPSPDSPAAVRARFAASNRSVIDELEADSEVRAAALPAGHGALPFALLMLFLAEGYGCYDVISVFDLPEASQAVVAVALAAFITWLTHAASATVSSSTAPSAKPTGRRRILALATLSLFAAFIVGIAALRLGASSGDSVASLGEVIVMLAISVGPTLLLLALWPRYAEGRALALALDQAKSKLKVETEKLQHAERFLDFEHDGPAAWDRDAAVSRARYSTEYDRAAARRSK